MIETTLRTTRLTHTFIIGISAAIFSFAISPLPYEYRRAVEEITQLENLPYDYFDDYLAEAARDSVRGLKQECIGFLNELPGLVVDSEVPCRFPYYSYYISRRTVDDIQLDVIRRFFNEGPLVFFGFSESSVRNNWLKSKSCYRTMCSDSAVTIYRWDLYVVAQGQYYYNLMPPPNEIDSAKLFMSFNPLSPQTADFLGPPPTEIIDALHPFECFPVDLVPHDFGRNVAVDWLKTQPHAATVLIKSENGHDIVMPGLSAILDKWDIVNSMTISEAKSFLERKIEEARGELKFMGVSVRGDVVFWLAPLATLTFMSFFIVHLRHLFYLARENPSLLGAFPWIALYPGKFSKCLTVATIVLSPITANLIILLRSGGTLNPVLFWTWTAITVIGMTVCGFLSIKTISDLNALKK